jgi:hypothetical protein
MMLSIRAFCFHSLNMPVDNSLLLLSHSSKMLLCELLSIVLFKCHIFCSHPIFCPVQFITGWQKGIPIAPCPCSANKPSSLILRSANSYQVIQLSISITLESCLVLYILNQDNILAFLETVSHLKSM